MSRRVRNEEAYLTENLGEVNEKSNESIMSKKNTKASLNRRKK